MPMRTVPLLADFEHPFEMLLACHGRLAAQLEILRGLVDHLQANGADAEAQQAASNVLRYFDSAARHHHEDEQRDLLPRMHAAAGPGAARIAALTEDMAREHADLERGWLELREALESIAHAAPARLDPIAVDCFCATYTVHMKQEEANVFPLAKMLLKPDDVAALGRDMARRRGLG
jgi:hemerythrin-like domain-containing protein